MKSLTILSLMFASHIFAATSVPFDRYITSVKQHRPTAEVSQFAKKCGVSLIGVRPVYGLAGAQWELSRNLPRDVYNKESDHLATAEIWKVNRISRIVDLWFFEIESEDEEMFCLDITGRVEFLKDIQWSLPSDGVGWWAYRRNQRFDKDGKLSEQSERFVDMNGRQISVPKLTSDEKKDLHQAITTRKLSDFEFPDQMLR